MQDPELTRLEIAEHQAHRAYEHACKFGSEREQKQAWSVWEGVQGALRAKRNEVERAETAPRIIAMFDEVSLAKV